MNKEYSQRIKTLKETKARRALMDFECIELKIQYNKLSNNQKYKLNEFFKQAKYLTNDIINSEDPFKYDYKTKNVDVRWYENNVLKTESKEITLPSQIKQDIKNKICTDICNLSKAKKKGLSVGKLKFRKDVNVITLVQYVKTWKFGEKNKLHIVGVGWVNVSGKDQLSSNIKEFGCAKLIRTPSGYIVQVTAYSEKLQSNHVGLIEPKDIIGLDFGIKDHITLSNGEKYNFNFDYIKVKKAHKRLSKKKKGSKNQFKQKLKLRKQYEKISNKKSDMTNKFVSYLKSKYKIICIQDDNLSGWQSSLFGKQVQHTILGKIKSKLKKLNITIIVDRFVPSTKLCPYCGTLNKLKLSDREYNCSCGFSEDRDTKSAKVITVFGLDKLVVPTERRDFKPVEILTSDISNKYKLLFGNFKSEIDEAGNQYLKR